MTAGISSFGAECLNGIVERLLKLGTAHAGLNGYCLIALAEGYDLVEVFAHIERDTAAHRLNASCDGGAAAVYVYGDFLLTAIFDNLNDILTVFGIENNIGEIFNDMLSQSHQVNHRLAVGNAETVIVVGADICLADYRLKFCKLFRAQTAGDIEIDFLKTHLMLLFEIVVRHVEGFLHQCVEL